MPVKGEVNHESTFEFELVGPQSRLRGCTLSRWARQILQPSYQLESVPESACTARGSGGSRNAPARDRCCRDDCGACHSHSLDTPGLVRSLPVARVHCSKPGRDGRFL